MNLWLFASIALALVAAAAAYKWWLAVRDAVTIAIGSRGPTVRSFEVSDASAHLNTLRPIVDFIAQQDMYRIWLVMETPAGRPPNAHFAETDYFIERIDAADVGRRLECECRNFSMFFLNADAEAADGNKELPSGRRGPTENQLLLAHDLVVKSAQIPERAFLGDTGAVLTLMRASDLLQIVSVTPPGELVFHELCDIIARAGKKAVVVKS